MGLKPQRLRKQPDMNPVGRQIYRHRQQRAGEDKAQQAFDHENSALKSRTAASAPSGCSQTPADTARKSAPASISTGALAVVMPPMATEGTTMMSLHPRNSSISAAVLGSLVLVGKKAPKAT